MVGVEGFSFDCEGLVFVVVFSPMNAILDGGVTKGKSSTGGSVFSDSSQGESSEQTNITTQNNTEVTASANISSLSDDFPTPLRSCGRCMTQPKWSRFLRFQVFKRS